LLLGQVGHFFQPAHLWGTSSVLAGFLLLLMFNLPSLPLALTLSFLLGLPTVGSRAGQHTMLQQSVPDRYRGRVYGTLGTIGALLEVMSVGLASALGDRVGIVPLLNVAAGLTLLAGITTLMTLPGLHYKYQADEADDASRLSEK
jgi:hypothetical protein